MLVTLSGLDGSGKSTLGMALKDRLEQAGHAVTLCHMNQQIGLYAYLRIARDLLLSALGRKSHRPIGAPPPHVSTGTKPIGIKGVITELRRRIIWNKPLRRLVDLFDLANFMVYRFVVERLRGRILVMDRYFYDRLADQANGGNWGYLRWFLGLVPDPDLSVLVTTGPAEAFARKGEYSIESMTARQAYYQRIFEWIPESQPLANDHLDRAVDQLEHWTLERMRLHPSDRLSADQP